MLNRRQLRAIKRAFRKLFKKTWKFATTVTKNLFDWFLRTVLLIGVGKQRQIHAKAGFMLPTVALLLVVVALVVGTILFRTSSRTNQVIAERNQQQISNAATPSIERAKAKIEYLFSKDSRLKNNGITAESELLHMMLNDGEGVAKLEDGNPYLLPDEEQIDINGDGKKDTAWMYPVDLNVDGQPETYAAYSIIMKSQHPEATDEDSNPIIEVDQTDDDIKKKASKLVVRNGPVIAEAPKDSGDVCSKLDRLPEKGWNKFNSTNLIKTFQVVAVTAQRKGDGNRTVVTQEYQQDRELRRNASIWFRDDLHIYPGTKLNWNGAMHTEGSLFVNPLWNNGDFTTYLISAPASCVYDPSSNSEITVSRLEDVPGMDKDYAFYGQVVSGDIIQDKFANNYSLFHIHGRPPKTADTDAKIDQKTDSVTGGKPSGIALDPVMIFTKDISQARIADSTNPKTYNKDISTQKWKDDAALSSRVRAVSKKPPYLDDTYRADDRLGPKPKYLIGENIPDVVLDVSKKNGKNIKEVALTTEQRDRLLNNTTTVSDTNFTKLGLDGYWERRARVEGMRIIGGARLELGNLYGWEGANDPLYPLYQSGLNPISHEQQQRRTLRDNLAAVQATAVFHKAINPDIAATCVSTTSHPGTNFPVLTSIQEIQNEVTRYSNNPGEPEGTIQQSTDFRHANETLLRTNFFTGKGTNGWEYEPKWTTLNDLNGGEWGKALRNLANFAGEIDGAFPPIKQDRVYPHPYLSMWGNFSNLRRSLEQYNQSIADDSYKQTAACTVGMLARNVIDIQNYNPPGLYTEINDALKTVFSTPPPANDPITPLGFPTTNPRPDDFITQIANPVVKEKARLAHLKEQIKRDREWGFAPVPQTTLSQPVYSYTIQFHSSVATPPPGVVAPFTFAGVEYDANVTTDTAIKKKTLQVGCNFGTGPEGNKYFGLGQAPTTEEQEKTFIRLATSLCSTQPKFPSLYYLFPTTNHGRNHPDSGDDAELYVQKTSPIPANFEQLDLSQIALNPKNDIGDFRLPTSPLKGDRPNPLKIKRPNNSDGFVSLLDAGIFNGREMMSVRTLDMDLDLLRQSSIGTDSWLPSSGIIYAFREDAIREDAISRPEKGDYTNPNDPVMTNATNTDDPRDPKIKDNGISPKAVDFYPDPDRRPYGFRLKNGKNLSRPDSGSYKQRGLTLISDNPVYIQGDFNVHKAEEFNEILGNTIYDVAKFYNRSNLNPQFATPVGDSWRPTEILADAITLLSQDFRDGDVASGLYGVKEEVQKNSYRAQNITDDRNDFWVREDGSVANRIADVNSFPNKLIPIKIYRNGNPRSCDPSGNILTPCTSSNPPSVDLKVEFSDNPTGQSRKDKINTATKDGKQEGTEINAVLVSGTVPARAQQGNGGLQNFPRFIENWKSNIPLKIQGAFFQLNFSTYATAPFELDSWEPTEKPKTGEYRWYYEPPTRVWGYDVGLQYVAAAPLSKRLDPSGKARSEFYEEPKANDPYICLLRRQVAIKGGLQSESIETVNNDCPQ
ncbi:hormogonium polysaccharide biosynthesis protein HpsA [Aerosakkonemataceae cyanobacterium BLCC-F154]|uniref:Hormogonium polysaccharide biosynthesis protein HpsA n=1 Tax=Floridaenema fluviatile BLCC-F154 TaxID=3153640 RepID=A0ABV4YEN3_9CYAN